MRDLMTKIVISFIIILVINVGSQGIKSIEAKSVEMTKFMVYHEPLLINDSVMIERGTVTVNEAKYIHINGLAHFLGSEVNFSEDVITLEIEEEQLFRLGLKTAEAISYKVEIVFDEVVDAYAAIIIEDSPKHVLFSKNKEEKLYPASTTKIMTALVALEYGNLEDLVTVSEEVTTIPSNSSKAKIRPGDVLTLKQLLYAMMLPSGNDAALAIAVHIAGSEEKFATMMNEKAVEIGAINTNFVNSHGYHDEKQFTTALDLAKISYVASKKEHFYPLVSTFSYEATYKNSNDSTVTRTWRATNEHLNQNSPYYSYKVIGGKTGFTTPSGHTLVSFAEEEGYKYITVILKGDRHARYNDTERLIERAVEMRSAYDEERKVRADVLRETYSVMLNGEEMMFDQLINVDNEIYFPLDAFVAHKEAHKNEKVRDTRLMFMLDQMYVPNKHFFRHQGQLFVPYKSPWIAYHMVKTFHNSVDAVDTELSKVEVAGVENTGASD